MRYEYNEQCFNDINNEEVLYWLGMMMADGSIFKQTHNNNLVAKLSLKSSDGYHVEKFGKFVRNGPQKLSIYKNSSTVRVYNQIICNRLLQLGLIPKKSLILKFPEYLDINNYNIRHFIRGYFDGDGRISHKRFKTKYRFHFSIVGTLAFLEKIMEVFYTHLNINKRKIIKCSNCDMYNIHINKSDDITKIKEFLYKDSIVHLLRKKEIFDKDVITKFGTTSKYKNICFSPGRKWRISYYLNGKRKDKSGFENEEEAYQALKLINSN